jgi:nucleosome binding factor SPN SPT16 subunit
VNGCRFRIRDETLDILYKNIRCAFFQPCDFELGAYIHFVLHVSIFLNTILFSAKFSVFFNVVFYFFSTRL